MMERLLLVFAALLASAAAISITDQKCFSQTTPTYEYFTNNKQYCTQAGSSTACLPCIYGFGQRLVKSSIVPVSILITDTSADSGNGSIVHSPFYPRVDEFSALQVYGSGEQYKGNSSIYVQVYVPGTNLISTPKLYSTADSYVGFWTITANINNGNITSLEWDDDVGCSLCADPGATSCLNNTCATKYSVLGSAGCTSNRCDMIVYLAWEGTDNFGTRMLSGGSIFSRYRMFAITPLYQIASAWVLSQVDRLAGNWNA